jgi:6-phosphogluconolactonase (cycloisomerase 2 family)
VHADLDEVSAYAIDKQNGHIAALNRQSCGGKNPVHLSIDPTGRWIVTANYSAGSVGVVPIEKDGTLGPRSDLVTLTGEPGPDGKRQTSSHPHDAVFDPNGRFVAVPDLGFDRIFVFRLDAANGKLTPNDPPFVATRAGAGPRHIAFHPKMPFGVCDQRTRLKRRHLPLRPAARQLAADPDPAVTPADYTGNNHGAEIAVAPCGRVVYASNRGHDSIGIFAVDQRSGTWRERGRELGFGVGIAQGYATLGQIGFSERSGYTAIGTVCNIAARFCGEAKDGQILLSQRVNVESNSA